MVKDNIILILELGFHFVDILFFLSESSVTDSECSVVSYDLTVFPGNKAYDEINDLILFTLKSMHESLAKVSSEQVTSSVN